MELVRCPQCESPAEIIDRFTLGGTGGPLEHVKTRCADGHWFTPRAADVQTIPTTSLPEPAAPLRNRAA
jgi:hypothetical protein